MKVTTIDLPIYPMDIVVIIDKDFREANKKYKLGFTEKELTYTCAWTVDCEENQTVYVLLGTEDLTYDTVSHELVHVLSAVCKMKGMKYDIHNDESMAYLAGYIGQRIFDFRDKHLKAKRIRT
jgi:hypothetical protein